MPAFPRALHALETPVEPAPPALNAVIASRRARVIARLVDVLLFWTPIVSVAVLASRYGDGILPLMLLGWLTLPVQALLIGARGQTVGKLLVGIAVVDRTGKRPTWVRSFAREAARYAGWTVPFAGFAALVFDAAPIFNPDRRMLHDRLSDTFVVSTRRSHGVRLGEVRDRPAPRTGGKRGVATAIVAFLALLFGLYAGLAPAYYARERAAVRAEVAGTVDEIRAAERAYYRQHGAYLAVGSEVEARQAYLAAEADGPDTAGWHALGWEPQEPPNGAFWVEVTGDDFRVVGERNDHGAALIYDGTRMHSAQPVSHPERL